MHVQPTIYPSPRRSNLGFDLWPWIRTWICNSGVVLFFFFKLLGMELYNDTCMFTLPSDPLPGEGNFLLTFDRSPGLYLKLWHCITCSILHFPFIKGHKLCLVSICVLNYSEKPHLSDNVGIFATSQEAVSTKWLTWSQHWMLAFFLLVD